MSNEYKDWLYDRVQEVLIDAGVIDIVALVTESPIIGRRYVAGYKNNQKVAFAVWFDKRENEWKYERRELNA